MDHDAFDEELERILLTQVEHGNVAWALAAHRLEESRTESEVNTDGCRTSDAA